MSYAVRSARLTPALQREAELLLLLPDGTDMGGGGSRNHGSDGASDCASPEPAPGAVTPGDVDDDTGILLVDGPACEWPPFGKKAVVPTGDHYDIAQFAHRIRRHISGTPCISGCRAHTTTRLGGPRRCSTRG